MEVLSLHPTHVVGLDASGPGPARDYVNLISQPPEIFRKAMWTSRPRIRVRRIKHRHYQDRAHLLTQTAVMERRNSTPMANRDPWCMISPLCRRRRCSSAVWYGGRNWKNSRTINPFVAPVW